MASVILAAILYRQYRFHKTVIYRLIFVNTVGWAVEYTDCISAVSWYDIK